MHIFFKRRSWPLLCNRDLASVGLDPESIFHFRNFRFEIDLSETELNWLILIHGYFFQAS